MANQDRELSSDLEWLLQSGQASQEELLTALAGQYLLPIYRLALAVLDEPAGRAWQPVKRSAACC